MRFLLICFAFCFNCSLLGQEYVRMMEDPSANFYDIQQAFNRHWEGRNVEKGMGYKQFKRWESFTEPRVYPTGEMPTSDMAWREFEQFRQQFQAGNNNAREATWNQYMYHDTLHYTSFSSIPGHGRLTCVTVSPSDSNLIYVGTPSGGLWQTTNGGNSWTPMTDHLPVLGVSDIVVHPFDDQVLYLGTGDNVAMSTYSIGVLKSTDGGGSWNPTGMIHQVSNLTRIRKLLIHPTHPDTLWAATTLGVLRTDDGGTNWYSVLGTPARDLEFQPGNLSVMYATSPGGFYKSTDGGASFQNSGLPENSAVSRMELAITPADSNVVYVLAADAASSGLYAVYRSVDAGSTFVQTAVTINILGYWPFGGTGGQGWYDMDIAVDPLDANAVYTAGINIWKSTDGGDTFAPTSDWGAPASSEYVHGDVHKLEFDGDRLFTACDGGLFRSDDRGDNWTDLSSNLSIYQIYSMAQSPHDDHIVIAGMQDVGSSMYKGSNWTTITWGDGFDAWFDPADSLRMYTSAHQGQFFRTFFGINSFALYTPATNETSPFASVMRQDPSNPQTFYTGFQNVWKSTNSTISWTQVSNFGNSFPLQRLRIAHDNPDAIYATSNFLAYRTFNGGSQWTNITPGLPTNFAAIGTMHVDPTNYQEIWMGFSGYVAGQKLYHSTDGGSTWSNISQNLPNIPVNCVETEGSALHGVYVGMDVGVYYTNDTINGWIPFMDGLPNVIVNDLDVVPGLNSIRAATFGRGVWESFLFSDPLPVSETDAYVQDDELLLYPNPAKERIVADHFQVSGFEPTHLQVIATNGQVVRELNFEISSQPRRFIWTHDLASGLYTVVLMDDHGHKVSGRFVKQE